MPLIKLEDPFTIQFAIGVKKMSLYGEILLVIVGEHHQILWIGGTQCISTFMKMKSILKALVQVDGMIQICLKSEMVD